MKYATPTVNNSECNWTPSSLAEAGRVATALIYELSWQRKTVCQDASPSRAYVLENPASGIMFTDSDATIFEDNDSGQGIPIIISRIQALRNYSDGWNGPDSVGPSDQTIKDAEQFANSIDFDSIHMPNVSLANDGEISFFWDIKGLYLDLGFLGDGSYSFYAKPPKGKEVIVDNAPLSRPLPQNILNHLRNFI